MDYNHRTLNIIADDYMRTGTEAEKVKNLKAVKISTIEKGYERRAEHLILYLPKLQLASMFRDGGRVSQTNIRLRLVNNYIM